MSQNRYIYRDTHFESVKLKLILYLFLSNISKKIEVYQFQLAEFARGIKCEGILHHTVNNVIHSLVSNQATHNVTLILVSKTTPHREANLMILE